MINIYWIFASIFAGLLTFFSPCVLPVLPIVLSSSLGGSKLRPFWIVSGLVLSFTFLGLALNFLGSIFGITPQAVRYLAILLLFIAGILFLFPELSSRLFLPLTQRFGRAQVSGEGPWGALLLGASMGAVWTPCAGPIFAVVLSGALLQRRFVDSFILLFVYALGAGLPMLAVAYAGNRLVRKLRNIAQYENKIRRATGAILVLTSLLFGLGLDTRLIANLPVSWFNSSRLEEGVVRKLKPPHSANKEESISKEALPVLGKMPQLEGIKNWINSEPLTREALQGKVVLVDFWTYSCINCLRTLPYLIQWYQHYQDQGLVILGIHTPEFAFEKDLRNVEKAVSSLGVRYPVALDNDYGTWRNFNNQYWPAHFLIDAQGRIRYQHFGEGEYERTEAAIQSLLREKGAAVKLAEREKIPNPVDFSRINSPETYVGYKRMSGFQSPESLKPDQTQDYSLARIQALNTWSLAGPWKIEEERAINQAPHAKLRFQFEAQRLNLVMAPSSGVIHAIVRIDGKLADATTAGKDVKDGTVVIDAARLYELLDLRELKGSHLFEIEFLEPDAQVFAFTFG
jgi:cytochrome c biogenesis protein CcdA/thiol-disulfide isomerase/thioredoxin